MRVIKINNPQSIIEGFMPQFNKHSYIGSLYVDPNVTKSYTELYGKSNNQFVYTPDSNASLLDENTYIIFDIDLTPKYYTYMDKTSGTARIVYKEQSDYDTNPPEHIKEKALDLKNRYGELYDGPYCITKMCNNPRQHNRVPKCISREGTGIYDIIMTSCIFTEEYMFSFIYCLYHNFLRNNGQMFFVLPDDYFKNIVPLTQKYFLAAFLHQISDYPEDLETFTQEITNNEYLSYSFKSEIIQDGIRGFYIHKI
jgi:hypothetical protein